MKDLRSPSHRIVFRILVVLGLYAGYLIAIALLDGSRPVGPGSAEPGPGVHPDRVAAGRELWVANECRKCHSADGRGGDVGPDLAGLLDRRPDAYIRQILGSGRGKMPSFGFSEAQVDALTAYLALLAAEAPAPTGNRGGRPAAGRELWLANGCQSCHSIYGLGGHSGPDLTNVVGRRPIAYIRRVLSAGQGAMPAFALSPPQQRDLTAYLALLDATGTYPPLSLTDSVF